MTPGIVLHRKTLWADFGPDMCEGVFGLRVFVKRWGQRILVALLEEAHTSPNSLGQEDRLVCFLEAQKVCYLSIVLHVC
jgi:hypothetical protein